MNQRNINRQIRYVLRCAMEHNGKAYFNPYMYKLGFTDNIPIPRAFNQELCKYGELHYDGYVEDWVYYEYDNWDYFEIDERGLNYMKQFEISGLGKILRTIASILLSIIQYVCILEWWISYFLNCILKLLSTIFFPIALLSFVWCPLDVLSSYCWILIDMLKHMMWDRLFSMEESSKRWFERMPEL